MSIAISDALQQAQHAIESGDFRSAVQTCNQLVKQFPDYAAAYRVLGEAYLEQGLTAEAEQAFAQALMRDPRQPWAYHGLGLIAEGQDVLENALAFCQVAWELAPNHARLRDPVIRIATRRFGADGQAQLTSAALAQIYSSTSRLQRAATEYRGALADLPGRVDLKLGLAETLWQIGKNDESADLCRQVLEENPVVIQALIILADIEGRSGKTSEAADLRARIRAIDPDGSITALMLNRNDHADRAALLLQSDAIPILDDTAEAVVAQRPHIAPAPDFSYQPARAEQQVQDIEDLEPISAEEFGTEPEASDDISENVTSELQAVGFAGDAPSIFRADEQDEPVATDQDVSLADQGGEQADQPAASAEQSDELADFDDLDALMAEFGDVEPMGIEEFGAQPEDLERLANVEQELLADGDDMFAGLGATPSSSTGSNEHVRSLASALENDVAGALDRTGEFSIMAPGDHTASEPEAEAEPEIAAESESDAEVAAENEEQTPDSLSGTGYTTVLRELGDEGFTPFDPLGRSDLQDSPAQAHFAGADSAADDAHESAEANELLKLTEDWENIDDEIARAVPLTTGHTDQLRAADDLGIAPFDFETEDDTSRLPAYRPFGEDDDELPELDAEPVQDEVAAAEESVAEADTASQESAQAPTSEDDLFDTLEPFSMEEIDEEEETSKPFSFGSLPWETGDTGSAVPSDADLELLLASEQDAEPVAEEPEQPAVASDWPTRVLDSTLGQPEAPVDWTTAIQDDADQDAGSEPDADIETEHDPVASPWNLPDDWDSSLAVTRQIGNASEDDFAGQVAAAEPAESDLVTSSSDGLLGGTNPEQLVADEGLFERTRTAKSDMISHGTISGDLELDGDEPEAQPEPEPETEEDSVVEETIWADTPAEDDYVVTTAASRDVNTLRASLEAAPNDDELHWWLAEALRERGDVSEAYAEYRWIIRHAGHRSDDVINALNGCIEQEKHAEMGHRLLADIYRRRGAVALASSHAATAMAVRRKLRG